MLHPLTMCDRDSRTPWLVGLDLTAGQRPATLAALSTEAGAHHLVDLRTDHEILAFIRQHRPLAVAIDSPIGLPRGLCCLEPTCACAPAAPGNGRACERALSRLGIGSYYTTKRSIIKAMVYRAIALRRALEAEGYPVLEVYPYATKVRLFGAPIPGKATAAGRRFIEFRLGALLDRPTGPLTHDQADALLCAYTAWLWTQGRTEALGEAEEGQLHVPRASGHRGISRGSFSP